MVVVQYRSPGPSAGPSSDIRVPPHLMSPEEMNDILTIVRIDESENQWTKKTGQIDIRPADELADPGPRGRFEPTPATSAEFALDVSRALNHRHRTWRRRHGARHWRGARRWRHGARHWRGARRWRYRRRYHFHWGFLFCHGVCGGARGCLLCQ